MNFPKGTQSLGGRIAASHLHLCLAGRQPHPAGDRGTLGSLGYSDFGEQTKHHLLLSRVLTSAATASLDASVPLTSKSTRPVSPSGKVSRRSTKSLARVTSKRLAQPSDNCARVSQSRPPATFHMTNREIDLETASAASRRSDFCTCRLSLTSAISPSCSGSPFSGSSALLRVGR